MFRGRWSRQPYGRKLSGDKLLEKQASDNLSVAISDVPDKHLIIPEGKLVADSLNVNLVEGHFVSILRESPEKFIILNREMGQVCTLPFELVKEPLRLQNYDTGQDDLIFEFPLQEQESQLLQEGYIVLIRDEDENIVPFLIHEIYTVLRGNETKKVICGNLYYELAQGPLMTYGLGNVLDHTRWQWGDLASGFISDVDDFYLPLCNPLEWIRAVEIDFDYRFNFRVDVNELGITEYLVDVETIDDDFKGMEFEFRWNLRDVNIHTDYSNLKTALTGLAMGDEYNEVTGQSIPMTFEDEEWVEGQPYDVTPDLTITAPVNKPLGQNWVGDNEARTAYGIYDPSLSDMRHRHGRHESEAQTPQTLLWWTWLVLQRRNRPLINIETTVADLGRVRITDILSGESLELSHQKIRLGNICRVIARHEGIDIAQEARIISVTRWLKEPEKTAIELGDYRNKGSDRFRALTNQVIRNERQTTRVVSTSKDYADQILQQLADGTYPYEGTFIDETKIYSPEIISPLVIGLQGFFDELIAGSAEDYMHLYASSDKPYIDFYDDETLRMRQTSDRMNFFTSSGVYGGMLVGEEEPTFGLPTITMVSPYMSRILSIDDTYFFDRAAAIATRVNSGDLSITPELQLVTLDIADRVSDTGTATSGDSSTLTDSTKTWDDGIRETGVATGATNDTLSDNTKTWDTDEWETLAVRIVSGTGEGQSRIISSNTGDTLTVSAAWDTNPDGTSVYEIFDSFGEFALHLVKITAGTGIDQVRLILSNTIDTLTISEEWDTNPDNTSEYKIYVPNSEFSSITMSGNQTVIDSVTGITRINAAVPTRAYVFQKNGSDGTGIINFKCE